MTSRRGTSNSNTRGNSASRRARRAKVVKLWKADTQVLLCTYPEGVVSAQAATPRVVSQAMLDVDNGLLLSAEVVDACRCYRCGQLLTAEGPHRVSCDRWVELGVDGGRYHLANVRPSCLTCASQSGGFIAAARNAARKVARR